MANLTSFSFLTNVINLLIFLPLLLSHHGLFHLPLKQKAMQKIYLLYFTFTAINVLLAYAVQ